MSLSKTLKLAVVACVLSLALPAGLALAVYTPPLNSPPICDDEDPGCDAPIHTGMPAQNKEGRLTLGLTQEELINPLIQDILSRFGFGVEGHSIFGGTIVAAGGLDVQGELSGVWQENPGGLSARVNGKVGAVEYCDITGVICFTADQVGGGGSGDSLWATSTTNANNIYNKILVGNVGIGTNNPTEKFEVVGGDSKFWGAVQALGVVYTPTLSLAPQDFDLEALSKSGDPSFPDGIIVYDSGEKKFKCKQNRAWVDCIGTGGGTVTSVGLSTPGIFTVTAPGVVTTNGTLGFTLNSQNSGTVLAAPAGANGVPSFRALADTDIPVAVKGNIVGGAGVTVTNGTDRVLGATDVTISAVAPPITPTSWPWASSTVNVNNIIAKNTGGVGIGIEPGLSHKLVTPNIGFYPMGAGKNFADKRLYAPVEGTLEWLTHSAAAIPGFAVNNQSGREVFLSANDTQPSYFMSGNVGIGTITPTNKLTVISGVNGSRFSDNTNNDPADHATGGSGAIIGRNGNGVDAYSFSNGASQTQTTAALAGNHSGANGIGFVGHAYGGGTTYGSKSIAGTVGAMARGGKIGFYATNQGGIPGSPTDSGWFAPAGVLNGPSYAAVVNGPMWIADTISGNNTENPDTSKSVSELTGAGVVIAKPDANGASNGLEAYTAYAGKGALTGYAKGDGTVGILAQGDGTGAYGAKLLGVAYGGLMRGNRVGIYASTDPADSAVPAVILSPDPMTGQLNPNYAGLFNGKVRATGDICTDAGGGKCLSTAGGGSSQWTTNGFHISNSNTGRVGIGTGATAPSQQFQVDKGNVLIRGNDNFASPSNAANLFLGDAFHYIRAINGVGLRLGTFGAADALAIQQSTGNVGIGNTSPASKLDVAGDVCSTVGGIRKCLSTAGGGLTGGVANTIPKWTSATAIGNSQITDDGATVKVGSVASAAKFATILSNYTALGFGSTVGSTNYALAGDTSNTWLNTPAAMFLRVGNNNVFSINAVGARLDGSLVIADGTQGAGKVLTSNASGLASWVATSTLGLKVTTVPVPAPNDTTNPCAVGSVCSVPQPSRPAGLDSRILVYRVETGAAGLYNVFCPTGYVVVGFRYDSLDDDHVQDMYCSPLIAP